MAIALGRSALMPLCSRDVPVPPPLCSRAVFVPALMQEPPPLTAEEKAAFMGTLTGVSLVRTRHSNCGLATPAIPTNCGPLHSTIRTAALPHPPF